MGKNVVFEVYKWGFGWGKMIFHGSMIHDEGNKGNCNWGGCDYGTHNIHGLLTKVHGNKYVRIGEVDGGTSEGCLELEASYYTYRQCFLVPLLRAQTC